MIVEARGTRKQKSIGRLKRPKAFLGLRLQLLSPIPSPMNSSRVMQSVHQKFPPIRLVPTEPLAKNLSTTARWLVKPTGVVNILVPYNKRLGVTEMRSIPPETSSNYSSSLTRRTEARVNPGTSRYRIC